MATDATHNHRLRLVTVRGECWKGLSLAIRHNFIQLRQASPADKLPSISGNTSSRLGNAWPVYLERIFSMRGSLLCIFAKLEECLCLAQSLWRHWLIHNLFGSASRVVRYMDQIAFIQRRKTFDQCTCCQSENMSSLVKNVEYERVALALLLVS